MSNSWKCWHVIRSTAHHTLQPQPPLLLAHAMTLTAFKKFCWGCHLYSIITTCYQCEMRLKISSAKWQLFCPGGDELTSVDWPYIYRTNPIPLYDKAKQIKSKLCIKTLYCSRVMADKISVSYGFSNMNIWPYYVCNKSIIFEMRYYSVPACLQKIVPA